METGNVLVSNKYGIGTLFHTYVFLLHLYATLNNFVCIEKYSVKKSGLHITHEFVNPVHINIKKPSGS